MQGVARTTAEEKRKRAAMVGNDSVNISTKGEGMRERGYKISVALRAMIFLDLSRLHSQREQQPTTRGAKCPYNRQTNGLRKKTV
jgi:hypothetical protein